MIERMMIERMLKEIAPGGVFHAFGHDYVVLDHNFASVAGESGVFCLDCGDVETSKFNTLDADEPNNYFRSELYYSVEDYIAGLNKNGLAYENMQFFDVALNELDGSYGYAPVQAVATPLTLWQFGRYKHLLPKNVFERPFWLVTPWTRSPDTNGSNFACYVWTDGTAYNYYVDGANGCRPALLFRPETLVSCDGERANHSALSGILTDDLLKEISRMVQG